MKTKSAKSPNFQKILHYCLFLIPVGVIGHIIFTLLKTDKSILPAIKSFSYEYLALAFILALVPWVANTARLTIWTRFLGKKYPISELYKTVLGSELASAVSPTAIGGGYVKMAMLIQKGLPSGTAASLMTLGTVEDLIFFMVAIPISILWTSAHKLHVFQQVIKQLQGRGGITTVVLFIFGGFALLLFILGRPRIKKRLLSVPLIAKIHTKAKRFLLDFIKVYKLISQRGKSRLALSLLLTSIQWTCRYSIITALLACLHVPVHPVEFFIFQWVVFTVMTFTPTPGGSVGAEAAFYFIYQSYIPGEMIALATAGWRFLTYYFQLSLGAVIFTALNFGISLKFFKGSGIKKARQLSTSEST
jgi:uncharacterized protein (TIRG00374 family)